MKNLLSKIFALMKKRVDEVRNTRRKLHKNKEDLIDRSPGYRAREIWPREYIANPPLRYFDNYDRYLEKGGSIRPNDDVLGYVAKNPINSGDMARFFSFCLIFDQIEKEGLNADIAELGVYKGNTASLLAGFARRLGVTAYFLDTYEGFSDKDLSGIDSEVSAHFSDTDIESVEKFVGLQNAYFIKGHFPNSADLLPSDGHYCLVHIDCDLYAPMQSALEYFYPRVIEGGFIIMHDYSSLHWPGAEAAIDEFFANKPESIIPLADWSGSAVIRKKRSSSNFGK